MCVCVGGIRTKLVVELHRESEGVPGVVAPAHAQVPARIEDECEKVKESGHQMRGGRREERQRGNKRRVRLLGVDALSAVARPLRAWRAGRACARWGRGANALLFWIAYVVRKSDARARCVARALHNL